MKMTKKKTALVASALIAVVAIGIAYAVSIGVITLPWVVKYEFKAVMDPTAVAVTIGDVIVETTKTVDPAPTVPASVLTVYEVTDISAELGGTFGGFTALSVTVQLVQDTTVVYETTVTETTPSATIPSVAVGAYDVYVGFSATAGPTPAIGDATVTLSYP